MYHVSNGRIHHTKCEMLVSLVPGGSLSSVAVCQVSHKLASTRDTRVMPSKGRIMKEARHSVKKKGEGGCKEEKGKKSGLIR